jgi:hypothetical protein
VRLRTILALAYGVFWIGFLLLMAVASKAQARDCVWRQQSYACVGTLTGHLTTCTRWRCVMPRTYHYRDRDPHWTDVERRHRHYRPGRDIEISNKRGIQSCKDFVVRVTGDDRLSHERARTSAQDRWAVTVGTRYGTLWADIDNAEDQDMSCVKQAPSSTTEKTQADLLGIRHNICELVARPCQPVPKEQDSETRAKRRFER